VEGAVAPSAGPDGFIISQICWGSARCGVSTGVGATSTSSGTGCGGDAWLRATREGGGGRGFRRLEPRRREIGLRVYGEVFMRRMFIGAFVRLPPLGRRRGKRDGPAGRA